MNDHVVDLAELYALGALEPEELAAIDAHVVSCADCRVAVGAAEATVAALDDAFVPHEDVPPALDRRIARAARDVVPLVRNRAASHASRALPAPRSGALAAAAVVAVALTSLTAGIVSHEATLATALAKNDVALAAIVHSHFNHVQLVSRTPNAPSAKALYGREGRWVYVVVDSTSCACHVVLVRDGNRNDIGPPQSAPGTENATAFSASADRPSRVELVAASGEIVADAPLTYAR